MMNTKVRYLPYSNVNARMVPTMTTSLSVSVSLSLIKSSVYLKNYVTITKPLCHNVSVEDLDNGQGQ